VPSLVSRSWDCLEVILQSVNKRERITYSELADKLNLELARQEWHTVLDSVAWRTKRDVGCDLTWNVVYARGPAKNLGRYFSNGGKATGSTLLDPKDHKQVADYERTLQEMYQYTYAVRRIEGEDTVIKLPRSSRDG
jgi:hypothetical protein